MSLAYSTRYVLYEPVVLTDTFAVPFPIFSNSDLRVEIDGVETVLFSVTANYADGRSEDAYVVLDTAVTDVDVEIYGDMLPARASDYLNSSPDLAKNLQFDVDFLTAIIQETVRDTVAALAAATTAQAAFDSVADDAAAAAASAAAALAAENSLLEWAGSWANATNYAPSDIVYYLGSAYICISAHTSTVLSYPTAAPDKWELFVSQGASGTGSGDVVAANNLSDLADPDAARANLEAFLAESSFTTSTDLDTLTTSGAYKLQSLNTNTFPGQLTGDVLLVVAYSAINVMQIGFRLDAEPILYVRRRFSGGWGSWYAIASQDYVDTAVAGASGLTLATKQASTSGTEIDFTGIPAGTKEIVVMFDGASLNGTNHFLVQLGDAGGFETSGYTSASSGGGATASSTAGFIIVGNSAATGIYGQMALNLMDASTFTWAAQHGVSRSGIPMSGGGAKSLSAELTQIRITSTGGNSFDAGSINIAYR